MIKGTVKFFNTAKGFGFISPDDGSKDVFLPAATITASGAARLKPGQRVSFEPEPDVKGPKAVKLTLLEEAPAPVFASPAPPSAPVSRIGVTVYHDPSTDESDAVLQALAAAGYTPRLIDYVAAPPAREELKRLSLLLRDADQNLVRRYDHLFFELQLDDRFIADSDYWTAIHEHPSLINGPVVQVGNKARLCRTARDVQALLGAGDGEAAPRKPKALSPLLAAMLGAPMPVEEPEAVEEEAPVALDPVEAATKPKPKVVAKPEPKPEPKAKARPEPVVEKPKAGVAKKSEPGKKPVAKAPAKKAAAKPTAKAKSAAPAKKKR